MAERLACHLAHHGLVIFSGMARGVETAGHRSALPGKGKIVAVLGPGVNVISPCENNRLPTRYVLCGGAITSEFPMSTFAAPQNFPIRNRTITGLSMGVLVVEAAEYSGTRTTARCALEQRRVCGARQRDQQELVGAKHQARSEAGRHLGGCLGGIACGRASCPGSSWR